MIFSHIVNNRITISKLQEEKGLPPQKQSITMSEIISDAEQMIYTYNEIGLSLRPARIKEFVKEVQLFHDILRELYRSDNSLNSTEKTKLIEIISSAKMIRDSSLSLLQQSDSQSSK